MRMKKKGFALTFESACALALMLLLVGLGMWHFADPIRSSKMSTAKGELSSIAAAVSQYHYEIGEYPATGQLNTLTKTKNGFGPWIASIPKDPWGNNYEIVSNSNRFIVYAKGSGSVKSANDTESSIKSGVAYVIGQ